ncbi:MAG: amino acid ABC transporter permease [Christensenellales bacterium]
MQTIFAGLSNTFYLNFIKDDRFAYLAGGLWVSLQITLFAAVLGIIIGLFMSIFKIIDKKPMSTVANTYITIIRGTPAVVQLVIIYFVILPKSGLPKLLIASIAFGINSGAYVAEIIRAGIQAVNKGQTEAARSLGLSYGKAMRFVIIPQAIKNILPALGNEFIVLLKETSIAGYIALDDLTRGANIIKSLTYDAFPALLMAAYIYLLLVMGASAVQSRIERRMKKSD